MAKLAEKDIKISFVKDLDKLLPKSKIVKLYQSLGTLIVKLIRERTMAGVDLYSQPFAPYSKKYNKARALNYATTKLGLKRTQYSTTGKGDIRLTGSLFSNMFFENIPTKQERRGVFGGVRLYIKGAFNKDKVLWLSRTWGATRGWGGKGKKKKYSKPSRVFFGLATKGAYKKRENEAIKEHITAFLKENIQSLKVKIT